MRMWISPEDIEKLRQTAERTGLSQVEIASQVLHAGIEAISERGSLSFPMRFAFREEEETPRYHVIHEDTQPKRMKK